MDSTASERIYAFAKGLHKQGYEVTVLTTHKQKQIVFPFEHDTSSFKVVSLPYFDPLSLLFREKKAIVEKTEGEGSRGVLSFFKEFYRTRMHNRLPSRTDFWITTAMKWLRRKKRSGEHYDLILSSYGPPAAHLIGLYAKRYFQSFWVADFRDLWTNNHFCKGLPFFRTIEQRLERAVFKEADLITTVSDGLAEVLKEEAPTSKIHVIPNGFNEERLSTQLGKKKRGHKKRISYVGTYFKEHGSSPLFFDALEKLMHEEEGLHEKLEVRFFGRFHPELSHHVRKRGLDNIVQVHGLRPQEEADRELMSTDLLLFFDFIAPPYQGILSSKLFEYLYAPAPILSVGGKEKSSVNQLIQKCSAGVAAGNCTHTTYNALKRFLMEGIPTEKDPSIISEYSRNHASEKLHQKIEALQCT